MTPRLEDSKPAARRDAVVRVPARTFAFGDAIFGDVTAEFGRLVPFLGHFLPFLWVRGEPEPVRRFERRARNDEAVESLTPLETGSAPRLYRVTWSASRPPLVEALDGAEVVVRRIESHDDEWCVHLLGLEPRSLAVFGERCADRGVPLTIDRLSPACSPEGAPTFGLTPTQAEALRVALNQGYFDVPRGATLDELGDELGITRQAVSLRLRRGTRRLVEAAFPTPARRNPREVPDG